MHLKYICYRCGQEVEWGSEKCPNCDRDLTLKKLIGKEKIDAIKNAKSPRK